MSYVSDGYGNSRVHKFAPDGTLLLSWGEPGTDPGQFNIPHNICCDADGWVYVADRENHRVQVFDGNGKYEGHREDSAMIDLIVNGRRVGVSVPPGTPLLWALREALGLTGTKFGCGIAQCGACTVHVDGDAVRSCVMSVSSAAGRQVTTIEGLAAGTLHPVQDAWMAENVPQCGYCQSGQIMAAIALLAANPTPTDGDIDEAMSGNICRCGTYQRIRRAIHRAAGALRTGGSR